MSEKENVTHAEPRLVFEVTSPEEALERAAAEWGVRVEELKGEVIGEEKSFFGLFGKKLTVQVTPSRRLLLLKGRDFLEKLLGLMDLAAGPEFSAEDENMVVVVGPDSDILVGRYGDGLKSMEYLLNLALRDPGAEPRVRLDCNGYRERRTRSLERLAEATARQVTERGAPVRLDPMLSWERWVIHTTLKDRDDVETQSVGESPDRKVVVMPKLSAANMQESHRPMPRRDRWRRR